MNTNEELRARLPELPKGVAPVHVYDASVGNKWAPPCTDYYTTEQLQDYAIAALARQDGREAVPFGKWPESMIEAAESYLTSRDIPIYRLGGSFNWHEFFDAIAKSGTHPAPPSAGEGDAIKQLRYLYREYVKLLEGGRDRIVSLGGECDAVDYMEHHDPALIQVRRFLATLTPQSGEADDDCGMGPVPFEVHERELGKLIDERDRREQVIDEILDLVLGADRAEWSSAYGYDDAINDVEEYLSGLSQPHPAPASPPIPTESKIAAQSGVSEEEIDALRASAKRLRLGVEGPRNADILERLADRLTAAGAAPDGWQPIETAPRDTSCVFWIVPKSADETYTDTSGNPILSKQEPYMRQCKYGEWGSLVKATHWHALQKIEPPTAATPNPGAQHGQEG